MPIPSPDPGAPFKAADFAGHDEDRLYFNLPRELHGGMERAYRYDALAKQAIQMYISNRAVIAVFADGEVERFGDRDEAAGAMRCPVKDEAGARLAPFSACRASWDVTGRFERTAP